MDLQFAVWVSVLHRVRVRAVVRVKVRVRCVVVTRGYKCGGGKVRVRCVVVTRGCRGCSVYDSVAEGVGRGSASGLWLEGRLCSILGLGFRVRPLSLSMYPSLFTLELLGEG